MILALRGKVAEHVFLNQEQEDWNGLAGRLSQIYSMRQYRTLYLLADLGVPFQTVAHALDTWKNAPISVGVPTENSDCSRVCSARM